MANLVIKAPQLGIIDPILDVYFAKVIEKDKGILLEKLEEAYLYQKVSVVVEVPQKVATLLYLKLRLYFCNKESNKGEVFKVQQKGKEVDTIEMTISSNQKEGEVVYTAIAEIDLYTQDKEKMENLEKESPLDMYLELTWGVRDFNTEYSLKMIEDFDYKESYFYYFFGEGKWFKIDVFGLNPDEAGLSKNSNIKIDLIPAMTRNTKMSSVIKAIILHRTVSPNYQGERMKKMKDKIPGAHFFVDKDGTIYQTVSLNNVAAHLYDHKKQMYSDYFNVLHNYNTIGIEVVGMYNKITKTWEDLTLPQIESVKLLVKQIQQEYNISKDNIYPHEKVQRKTKGEGQTVLDAIK